MDNRMARINDEIQLARRLIALNLLTNEFYQANSRDRAVVIAQIERNLGIRFREERQYENTRRDYIRKKRVSEQIAPLEAKMQQLQAALAPTVDEGKIVDEAEHTKIQGQIQTIQRRLQRARAETQGINLGALEQAAGAAYRALGEKAAGVNTTRANLLEDYRKGRELLKEFRDARNAGELLDISAPEVQVEDTTGTAIVVQTAAQQQRLMQAQMPPEIRDATAQVRQQWMHQQRNLIGMGQDLGDMRGMLGRLLENQRNQATVEGQERLIMGQEAAHEHRSAIEVRRDEQFEAVRDQLDDIAADIARYNQQTRQELHSACYPLNCRNVFPCLFKFLGMIVQFIIYAHKVVYQATRVAGRGANVVLQGIPYVGVALGNGAEGAILIGMIMLYLSLWTCLFSVAGTDWDATEMFIFVISSGCELIKQIIIFFWDQIKVIPQRMGSFVYRCVEPLIDGIGSMLRGLWEMFHGMLCAALEGNRAGYLIGCPGTSLWGGARVAGTELSNDEFFEQLRASIPDELKEECNTLTAYLSSNNPDILSLQQVACNIIHKLEMDAKSGTSKYFKNIQAKLKKGGYGPSNKPPISDIARGLMKATEKITSEGGYLQKEMPKLVALAEKASSDLQNGLQTGKITKDEMQKLEIMSPVNLGFTLTDNESPALPFPKGDTLLGKLTSLVDMWDENFLFGTSSPTAQGNLLKQRDYIPFGLSIESAEVLRNKLLGKSDCPKIVRSSKIASKSKTQGISGAQLSKLGTMRTGRMPVSAAALGQGAQRSLIAATAGGQKKRTKKRRRRKRRYSRRRKNHKTLRRKRTKRRKYKKRKSRRKRSKHRRSR